jgi:DNA-binding ferritin-like protein
MDKHIKIAALYIATLRAITIIHSQNHWTTKGEMFYGEHLLFERIYNSSLEDLDAAAERFVGLFGEDCLNYDFQIELLSKVLSKYKNLEGSPVEMSLAVEKDFIKLSSDAYESFEGDDKLSLGLDDLLMSIASKREEATYLLQQTLSQ